ncbi:ABSCISIC ACID-INSENSITIVE 5-like protein 2 [Vigna unguiculata]|uniref:ABSCISIC ACID-INSENSITIVE 5-like protein 2 n=1 Tax=Vigna unguiculata TaxID=3917 RepID=UPI001016CBEF|nr:ABSCISIC ACID-INSENSITIVE 5-like protein 2 [Vigna unguiculata]
MGSQGGAIQEPKNGSLARQGSLYNLTLDEVHNQLGNLGKPLGSMNLDELLKGVWTAESGTDAYMQQGQVASAGSSLNPQGSLTLCGDLSKKTIDEVWRDMQQKKSVSQERERQPTLGEMTLEDFLVKAGVTTELFSNEDSAMAMPGVDSQHNTSQHAHWLQYQLTSVQQQQPQQQHHQHQNHQNSLMPGFSGFMAVQQPMPVVVNPVLDAGYPEAMPSSLMGALSDSQSAGRKRAASGNVVEKTVERRQKRMIKNRESAARSRARKQAYTQELEIKVSRLEEENERLRRQNEIEKVLPSAPPPDPKHQLRRTSSAPL